MRNKKNELDEMQKEKRNNIGNQMFMLMFYALLIDVGLYGAGIRWLSYPSNIMVIIMVCMSIYLVRTIAANSYMPPRSYRKSNVVYLIIAIVFSIVLAIAAFWLFGDLSAQSSSTVTSDNSALVLFTVSAVGLLMSLIVAIIKKASNKNNNDD